MDDSSTIDGDVPILGSSVASVLGIKGSLRFRLHGSTQKAHVVLRRVTISEESSDDGEGGNVVRFSLFAQKRIEVKPGKEILLTVASEDSLFKDRPVVLEGNLTGEEELSSAEDDTQVAEEEEVDIYIPPPAPVIPPKMRRGWTKKAEEVSPVTQRTYSSIAVQAEPVYISASVLAQPAYALASVQAHTNRVSSSVQVDHPSLRSQVSTAAQTVDVKSLEPQTSNKLTNLPAWVPTKENDRVERSLSPMELDSPPYSPTEFSAIMPIETPEPLPPLDIGLSQVRSPTGSSMGAEDMQLSPIETPAPLSPGEPLFFRFGSYNSGRDVDNQRKEIKGVSHISLDQPILDLSMISRSMVSESSSTNLNAPRKPTVSNPFVSAGFMTEFVGLTNGRPSAPTAPGITSTPVSVEKGIKAEPASPSRSILDFKSNTTEYSSLGTGSEVFAKLKVPTLAHLSAPSGTPQPAPSTSAVSQPLAAIWSQKPKAMSVKLPSTSQNAIASSSKVSIDKFPLYSPNPPTTKIPNGPRSLASLSNRAREKSPVIPSPSLGGRIQPHIVTNSNFPPPDPKALAYIPSGPSSNPLNIRPSGNPSGHGTFPHELGHAAPKPPQPSNKKRVIVGTGWPFVKSSGPSTISTPVPASGPPQPTAAPPPPPPSGPRSLNLSNIISYSSPSPPPPIMPVMSSTNKWRRVASDNLTGIVVDMPGHSEWRCGSTREDCKRLSLAEESPQTPSVTSIVHSPHTVSLKDRIGPQKSITPYSKQTSNPERLLKALNGPDPRDLRSRISDPPGIYSKILTTTEIQKYKGPSPFPSTTPPPQETPPQFFSTYDIYANVYTNGPSTPMSMSPTQTLTTQSFTHPLPRRPIATGGNSTPRGIKRERPPSPDLSMDFLRQRKRSFRWPTVDSNYSVLLKGEGDLGIKTITFSSDGSHFALSCADKTIRIWNNRDRVEIARLSHNSPITSLSWMYGDTGVVSLGEDGIISKWTRSGQNYWHWAKVLDAGTERLSDDDQVCMVYWRDRIAVSFPRGGVKVWIWHKGTWQAQRAILRQNVSAIRFVDDGAALLGGTRDGVLWYCEVPNGTLRAYAFLKNRINSLDISPTGSHVLVGQMGGCARLVGIRQSDNKGAVEQSYSCKETEARPSGGFGATFATQGQAILFGNVEGCVLVWDRKKGAIVYGLEHEEDDLIQAVASFDELLPTKYGCLVTGTKQGLLAWWSQPVAATHTEDPNKRSRLGT
ncbi:hypothetical protein BDZ94DRAFT_1251452 [Collybia nuda]|uniref:WD40 repeat-like protein n=1 Tax=Collybia nuda TaxID=64659 RepID=A0A9P5YCM4_9AGAR|nr:hypothetical protein BDZ94DRAFT_1251452 [Collybia nuda]